MLFRSALAVNDWLIYDCLSFRQKTHKPRFSGSVIPVFSLRSEQSFGVGDFSDLRKFIDWAALTQQRLIQILPINDTTATHAWTDSYPYSAISIYALHPMYISLQQLGALSDKKQMAFYAEKQKTLNALDQLNYEEVMRYKLDYCKAFYDQEGVQILNQADFQSFFKQIGRAHV